MKVLNIYKLNIYQVLTFIFKTKRDSVPAAFWNDFREISHRYPTGYSQSNFVEGNILSNQTKSAVSSRGPRVWNGILNQEQKNMAYINRFKNSVKILILYTSLFRKWIYIQYIFESEKENSGQKFRIKILYIVLSY